MILGLSHVVAKPPIPPIETRADLMDALGKSAEIEHAIMLQYLYAAFSIDRTAAALAPEHVEIAREFVTQLLVIARQEMEHLGIVTNLLIAVGAAPDFDRPNMPLQPDFYAIDLPFALVPFGDEFLDAMIKLEAPCAEPEPHPALPYYPSVAAILDRLRDGVVHLDKVLGSALWLGAKDPQISNADFGTSPNQIWYSLTLLPVIDLPSALKAIDLIRVQGEGTRHGDPASHYALVCAMKQTWSKLPEAVRHAMLRPMPRNPVVAQRGDVDPNAACVVLRDPRAVALARLANRAYQLLLLLLARQYGKNDATAADRDMYRKYAFFPLMTIVIRPIAEILCELPAGDGVHCATCTFEIDGPIRTIPDRVAFATELDERLSDLATGFAACAAMQGVSPRMAFVAKNMAYVRDRVRAFIKGDGDLT